MLDLDRKSIERRSVFEESMLLIACHDAMRYEL